MASHGGILGLVLALWVFARRHHVDPLRLLDAAAAAGPLGIAFGRITNFINGELWGRPATVFIVGQWVYGRTTRPGLTATVVCIAYGIGRFVDEFWREPDFGQPVYWGWMSKGQLLTIPMIVIGIFLTIR